MSTQTKDFTGSYDWPAEEAALEADSFAEYMSEYTLEQQYEQIAKLRAHWLKVFGADAQGAEDMARFCAAFNQKIGFNWF